MMTKQEERAALAKIEKIIKAAGPDSYIGMAFAGCCEIAADNIENDFGNSLKYTAEKWMHNAETEHDMRLRAEDECDRLGRAIDSKADEIKTLRQQLNAERSKQLPADLYKLVWLAVDSHIERANRRIAECVENLVQFAEAPKDIAVAHALAALSEAHAKKAQYTQLLEQLEAYEPKGV